MADLVEERALQVAAPPDEVRLDFETVVDVRFAARLGDRAQLLGRPWQVLLGSVVTRRVKGEAADQLRPDRLCQLDSACDVLAQVLLERHVAVARAVVHVQQLHLADR